MSGWLPSCPSAGLALRKAASAARGTRGTVQTPVALQAPSSHWPGGARPAPSLPQGPRCAQVCSGDVLRCAPCVWLALGLVSRTQSHCSDRGLVWAPGGPCATSRWPTPSRHHCPRPALPCPAHQRQGGLRSPLVPKQLPEAPPRAIPCRKAPAHSLCRIPGSVLLEAGGEDQVGSGLPSWGLYTPHPMASTHTWRRQAASESRAPRPHHSQVRIL